MSAGNGPSVATTGLVFYYDMSNTQKSWLGTPITNLYGDFGGSVALRSNTQFSWNGNAWDSNNSPGNSGLWGVNLGTVFKFTSGSINSTWSGNSYGYMFKDIATSNGTAYTGSFWCYVSPNCNIDYLPAAVEITGGYGAANLPGSYNMSNKGTWQRVGLSTTGAGGNSRFLIYPQRYGVTDGSFSGYFLVAASQVEPGSYASPYTPSARSNTQAIVDLTGNSVITANSLTYTSDNTFRFDGSQHLSVPNSSYFNMTTALSIEAWVKFDSNSDDFIFEKGDVNTQYSLFSHGDDIVFRTYHSGDGGYHTQNPSKATVGVVNGQWTHIVGSWDGTTKRIYINGVLRDAVSKSGSLVTTSKGASVGRFGGDTTGYYFNGLIGSVKVYNTGLSASEVKQNFSAARSRYGI